MADSEWGKCKECKWFQIEPETKAANNTMGLSVTSHKEVSTPIPTLLRAVPAVVCPVVTTRSGVNRL
jgi:hypothetical protein